MGEWGSFLVSQVRLRAFISARIGRVGVLLRPPLRILHAELPAVFKRFLGREMKNGSFVLILLRLLLCDYCFSGCCRNFGSPRTETRARVSSLLQRLVSLHNINIRICGKHNLPETNALLSGCQSFITEETCKKFFKKTCNRRPSDK